MCALTLGRSMRDSLVLLCNLSEVNYMPRRRRVDCGRKDVKLVWVNDLEVAPMFFFS